MKIETIEIAGFEASLRAMRLPHKSVGDSDSKGGENFTLHHDNGVEVESNNHIDVGPKDLALAQKLILAGTEHAKCIRGINVWIEITGPWYIFNEITTYTVGNTPLSSTSSMHIDCKGLKGKELQEAKGAIRGDFEYTRIYCTNYQCLRNMYFQRRNHRLPEWHEMCDWIESLPLSKELITIEKEC